MHTILYFVLIFLALSSNGAESEKEYGVVIDAGSSGSRVRVYAWESKSWTYGENAALPEITEEHNEKFRPGIADFGSDVSGVRQYVMDLITEASDVIPEDKHSETRLYMMATAGMRLLMEEQANDVIYAIDEVLSDHSLNPFLYESLNTRILSGEEEGVFAWITVNYLRGYFGDDTGVEDVGVLEMAGASTQIVFQHDGSILADKFPVRIAGKIYPMYVHSFLGFGVAEIKAKNLGMVAETGTLQNGARVNPCMLKGDRLTTTAGDNDEEFVFVGTGDAQACRAQMNDIVYRTADEDRCLPKPCSIGTVYQPEISTSMDFYAISAFVHHLKTLNTFDEGRLIQADGSYTLSNALSVAERYCSQNISDIEEIVDRYDSEYNSNDCRMALYVYTLFTRGYGFDANSEQLHMVEEIEGNSIDWALGALIYETERALALDCDPGQTYPSSCPKHVTSNTVLMTLFVFVFVLLL